MKAHESKPTPGTLTPTPARAGCTRDAGGRRAVIVTGASKRLGRAIAIGLAQEGWDILVHCNRSINEAHDVVAEIETLGRRALAVQADLGIERDVDALFDTASAALPLRAVVNSASRFEHDAPASFTAAHLLAHIGPNVAGPVRLARRLHAWLPEPERGAVVNILDQKLNGPNPDFFSYTMTKQALQGATTMMAMAFAPRLRVVGISPGLTLPSYLQDKASFERSHRLTALLDSSSHASDIVAAVVFMLDAPAITGVNLTVDGGQHLLGLPRDVSYLADVDR